jgi:hypothetical protein
MEGTIDMAIDKPLSRHIGFREWVVNGPNYDIVEIQRVAVSGFQRFNRGHVPLGDFQEKLGGVGGIVHLGLLAVASGSIPAPEGPFAL